MGLSSNIIWHQTKKKGFEGILNSMSLKCSYSQEDFRWSKSNKAIHIAFPMISFCNMPVADMEEYIDKYGGYIIGFKREWAKNAGLSPVWYREPEAYTLCNMMDHFKHVIKKTDELDDNEIFVLQEASYTKNFTGCLSERFQIYRFADEREIRYVPSYSDLIGKGVAPFLPSKNSYDNYKREHGKIIEGFDLTFTFQDVALIICPPTVKNGIVSVIKSKKGTEHIKIFSKKEILDDFIGVHHNVKYK